MTLKLSKHKTYKHVYCGEFATPLGRVAWPSLVTPKAPPDPKAGETAGAPRYEVTYLIAKDAPGVAKFIESMKECLVEGTKLFNVGRNTPIGVATSVFGKYGDGDAWDLEKYPYYKGMWLLAARNQEKPQCVDREQNKLDPATIKGGQQGRGVICPMITASGMSFKLIGHQFVLDDGVKFAGGARDIGDLLTELEEEEPTVEAPAVVEKVAEPVVAAPAAPTPTVEKKKGKDAGVNLLVA